MIFEAIQKNCRVPTRGYVGVLNVDDKGSSKEDKMETFFLVRTPLAFLPRIVTLLFGASSDGGMQQSETLKYLYLLFSEDTLLPLEGASVSLPFGTLTLSDFSRGSI